MPVPKSADSGDRRPDKLLSHILPLDEGGLSRRNKKGRYHIVLVLGPARPARETRAAPLSPQAKERRLHHVLLHQKLAGLRRNAKSTALNIQLSFFILGFAALPSKEKGLRFDILAKNT
jgi:hypothetical protein